VREFNHHPVKRLAWRPTALEGSLPVPGQMTWPKPACPSLDTEGAICARKRELGTRQVIVIRHSKGRLMTCPTCYDSTDATAFDNLPQGLARHPGRFATAVYQPFAHQGLLYEPEIGSYQNRARQYLASAGRFAQCDLLTLYPAVHMRYRDGLSLYAYVRANPVKNHDPSGLCCPTGYTIESITWTCAPWQYQSYESAGPCESTVLAGQGGACVGVVDGWWHPCDLRIRVCPRTCTYARACCPMAICVSDDYQASTTCTFYDECAIEFEEIDCGSVTTSSVCPQICYRCRDA
jgi:RHS repeat-associated protein